MSDGMESREQGYTPREMVDELGAGCDVCATNEYGPAQPAKRPPLPTHLAEQELARGGCCWRASSISRASYTSLGWRSAQGAWWSWPRACR